MSIQRHGWLITAEEASALKVVHGLALAGRFVVSRHAEGRMAERGVSFPDVREALVSATTCRAEPGDRWRLEGGHDCDGDPLTAVVAIEDGVVVVTLF